MIGQTGGESEIPHQSLGTVLGQTRFGLIYTVRRRLRIVAMSSTRTLTEKITWPEDSRAIELLDWETSPEAFDRLCEFIIRQFAVRDGVPRERLFSVLAVTGRIKITHLGSKLSRSKSPTLGAVVM